MFFTVLQLPPPIVPTTSNSSATTGFSLISQSISLSKATAASWDKLWGDVVNPSGALWAGLCDLGTILAAFSIILVAAKMVSDYQEKRFLWSELAASFVWPLFIAFFLGNNGYLLSQTIMLGRNIAHQQVVGVLNIQLANTTFQKAISDVTLTDLAKSELNLIYQECIGKTGKPLTDCLQEKQPIAAQILQDAEAQNGGPLDQARAVATQLADLATNPSQITGIFTNSISLIIISFLYALQWAFVNILEAALVMTATFAPIAFGLSLLPLGTKPIWAWASGFISLFGVQLGYNIIVGLAATVIVASQAQSASDLAFLAFISIFAPFLALLIAGGGGVALYTGIQSRVASLVNLPLDLAGEVLKIARFFA